MTLDELADELIEIRRYVRTDPDHVKRRYVAIKEFAMFGPHRRQPILHRVVINVEVGLKSFACNEAGRCVAVVDPEIIEGYLYGAAAEIRELAMREERGK